MEDKIKKAENLAKSNRYPEAFELLKEEDREGNSLAGYALGTWYLHGTFVAKDLKKGFQYLFKASKGNIKEAYFDLAVCYETGAGTDKNTEKAFSYYVKASDLGDKDAFYEVCRCLYYGIGTTRNKELAALIYDKVFNLNKQPKAPASRKKRRAALSAGRSGRVQYSS